MGLPQGEEPAGPGEQAVVHPGQAHGAGLRQREDQGLRDVQVSGRSSLQLKQRGANMMCAYY